MTKGNRVRKEVVLKEETSFSPVCQAAPIQTPKESYNMADIRDSSSRTMARVRAVLAINGRSFLDLALKCGVTSYHLAEVLRGRRPLKGHMSDALERELGASEWVFVQGGTHVLSALK